MVVLKQTLTIDQLQFLRQRIYERQKKTSTVIEALNNNYIRKIDMENLQIDLNNINVQMANALRPHLTNSTEKMTLATTDILYVDHLIKKGDLPKARTVLDNLKSVAKVINERIVETDCFLASMEV